MTSSFRKGGLRRIFLFPKLMDEVPEVIEGLNDEVHERSRMADSVFAIGAIPYSRVRRGVP